jgi:hypothetical protein
MTQPFKLTVSNHPNAHTGVYLGDDNMQDKVYDFMSVHTLDLDFNYDLRFQVETTQERIKKYDCIDINTPVAYLFNQKIIDIFMEFCPNQIQVFDAIVKCKDGDLSGYKAINILNALDVSDPEKSEYIYFSEDLAPPDQVMMYKKCIFKKDCMGDLHIARDEKFRSAVIVSETLKNALQKAKVKGLDFLEESY